MDAFNKILDTLRAQDKPNFTQGQLAIQEIGMMLEEIGLTPEDKKNARIATLRALRQLREFMEEKYHLPTFSPVPVPLSPDFE
jgi:hypothetical protein